MAFHLRSLDEHEQLQTNERAKKNQQRHKKMSVNEKHNIRFNKIINKE